MAKKINSPHSKQPRNVSFAPLLAIPALISIVPQVTIIQSIEEIQPVNITQPFSKPVSIEESFLQANNNGQILYIDNSDDNWTNLSKSTLLGIVAESTGNNPDQLKNINQPQHFFRVSSLNFAIFKFKDIKSGKSCIMVFGSSDGVVWSQTGIIKGQVQYQEAKKGGIKISEFYTYRVAYQESLIGGFVIPTIYEGTWTLLFNPTMSRQPAPKTSSSKESVIREGWVIHDEKNIGETTIIFDISLEAETLNFLPNLPPSTETDEAEILNSLPTVPSSTEIDEKDFNSLSNELSDIFYANEMATQLEREDGLNFLRELFYSLIDTLTNPEKIANILADTAIISPGLYLCWEFVKKMRSFAEKKYNKPLLMITSKCERLLLYFERVPKSRIAEISSGTGISVHEAKLLLQILCFVHEPNCFWRPPLQSKIRKQGNQKKKGVAKVVGFPGNLLLKIRQKPTQITTPKKKRRYR